MPRNRLTDKTCNFIKEILLETGHVYHNYEHRTTLEGILDYVFQKLASLNDPQWLCIGKYC